MSIALAEGVATAGHGVASGRSGDPRFPRGTIALQLPIFRARGVDVRELLGAEPFLGTINLDIAPRRFRVVRPEIVLPRIRWTAAVPPENFWLFKARLLHECGTETAVIYMPDPATKPGHFQPETVVEIIAAPIERLLIHGKLTIVVDPRYLIFT